MIWVEVVQCFDWMSEHIFNLPQEYVYSRKMGQYRPHFEGKPQSYYELSWREILSAVSLCLLIVVLFFWLCVAFFLWHLNVSTSNFTLVWSVVLALFVPLFMVFAYLGSRNKRQIETQLINQALRRETAHQKRGRSGVKQVGGLQQLSSKNELLG